MWFAATALFDWYLHRDVDYSVIYASLGVGISLLVWVYVISLIILVGAKFNAMLFPRSTPGRELRAAPNANAPS
jgi:membrane protein